ncbi:MAG: hypothetical protein P8J61_05050 [Gammaproteobacteria bacterium]|nr:hypothetical protein [Gammaproteobacteria bacterium]
MNRQFFQVCFLAFLLLGVQALQNSTIHDHVQHQVDCVLCHFDSHDQVTLSQPDTSFAVEQIAHLSKLSDQVYISYHYPSYQGRSPPRFYS